MNLEHTPRGFSVVNFTDSAHNECSIQESSSASSSKVWFGVNDHRMLLTQEEVNSLLPILQTFVETGKLSSDDDKLSIDI